jgi:hypothetical protein
MSEGNIRPVLTLVPTEMQRIIAVPWRIAVLVYQMLPALEHAGKCPITALHEALEHLPNHFAILQEQCHDLDAILAIPDRRKIEISWCSPGYEDVWNQYGLVTCRPTFIRRAAWAAKNAS